MYLRINNYLIKGQIENFDEINVDNRKGQFKFWGNKFSVDGKNFAGIVKKNFACFVSDPLYSVLQSALSKFYSTEETISLSYYFTNIHANLSFHVNFSKSLEKICFPIMEKFGAVSFSCRQELQTPNHPTTLEQLRQTINQSLAFQLRLEKIPATLNFQPSQKKEFCQCTIISQGHNLLPELYKFIQKLAHIHSDKNESFFSSAFFSTLYKISNGTHSKFGKDL